MKTLYLESIAGIAGDMFTASFVDAGLVTQPELQALCQQLQMNDVEIKVTEVIRSCMRATHIDVIYDEASWHKRFHHHDHHADDHFHVPYLELENIITQSLLENKTKMMAVSILTILAEAEARCHGVDKSKVAFHELGMMDSLIDIVMAAYCITKIAPERVLASPVKLGRGLIKTAHGTQPVPPPVSALLAKEMQIEAVPSEITNQHIELSTPTGLAILKALKPEFLDHWPTGKLQAEGKGAGTMNLDHYPNFFRLCLLESSLTSNELPYLRDKVMELRANYDDTTSEYLGWAVQKLFDLGALDVWQTPSTGKKGRILIVLSVLVEPAHLTKCIDFLLRSTTTFGVRYHEMHRMKLDRHFETRMTEKGELRFKIGCDTNGNKIKEKCEFDEFSKMLDVDLLE